MLSVPFRIELGEAPFGTGILELGVTGRGWPARSLLVRFRFFFMALGLGG